MLAAHSAADPGDAHQTADLIAADFAASPTRGMPQYADPVDTPVTPRQVNQRVDQVGLSQLGIRDPLPQAGVVGRRRDRDTVLREYGADRLDAEPVPMSIDVGHDHLVGGRAPPERKMQHWS